MPPLWKRTILTDSLPQENIGTPGVEFPVTWQRAFLPMRLLGELRRGPNHGYAVARALEGSGFTRVKGATLYPALAKLELDGFLSTTWEDGHGGPGRKVYALTPAGHIELGILQVAWQHFQASLIDQ